MPKQRVLPYISRALTPVRECRQVDVQSCGAQPFSDGRQIWCRSKHFLTVVVFPRVIYTPISVQSPFSHHRAGAWTPSRPLSTVFVMETSADANHSGHVDIYDAKSMKWRTSQMSTPSRTNMSPIEQLSHRRIPFARIAHTQIQTVRGERQGKRERER